MPAHVAARSTSHTARSAQPVHRAPGLEDMPPPAAELAGMRRLLKRVQNVFARNAIDHSLQDDIRAVLARTATQEDR